MAKASLELVNALRITAQRLQNGADYYWGHHGSCNCGNLLQVVAGIDKDEVLRYAHSAAGEWTEIAEEYCHVTNAPVSYVLSKLQEIGLTPTDIHNIEYLEDRKVLQALPGGFRWLKRNVREDVIVYFNAFAQLLEDELAQSVTVNWAALTQTEIAVAAL
ncbi:MAG: hypothetical protein SFU21_08500 [Flavihumibacter sp.]|nr:hypothetical protein [Flavihumibacter sp.]